MKPQPYKRPVNLNVLVNGKDTMLLTITSPVTGILDVRKYGKNIPHGSKGVVGKMEALEFRYGCDVFLSMDGEQIKVRSL